MEPSSDTNNPLANFEQAIQVFKAIGQNLCGDRQSGWCRWPGARSATAICNSPGSRRARIFTTTRPTPTPRSSIRRWRTPPRAARRKWASDWYWKSALPQATGPDQTALLQQALQNYLDVLYGKNLRDGEAADPFWVKKAGLQAASVAETLGEWPQAVNVYRRLEELLPLLHDTLEKKIANAQEHVPAGQD